MIESHSKKGNSTKKNVSTAEKVCDLDYLIDMMGGKKKLVKGIIDDFLLQIPKELQSMSYAVERSEFGIIKRYAHSLKSTLSIMGISTTLPVLREMEELGTKAANIERIKELNDELNQTCKLAIQEIQNDMHHFE